MANVPLLKSKHMLPFAAALREQGVNVHRLLQMAHLPLNCLDQPDTLIPVVGGGIFRELAAQKIGCPNLSLEVTRHLEIEGLGDFGRGVLREPTVHASLHTFRKLSAAETSNVAIELLPQANGDLWFGHRIRTHVGSDEWHTVLYVISLMLKVVRLADPAWSPAEISIGSKAIPTHYEAIEILGSTARLQQNSTGFLVPASMLALPVTRKPVVAGDTGVEETDLLSALPPETYADSLRQLIRSYACDGWLTIDQASEVTRTSVRTLQRRLSVEQKTYSDIIQEARAEMASTLLESTDAAILEIAHQLGYKNQSHFTRAFHRWAKVSPSEYRKHRSLAG